MAWSLMPRTPDPEVGGSSPTCFKPCCVIEQGKFTPQKYSLNVTTSGRNCNTIFEVLTSKMPNADRSRHACVCVCDFVLIKSEHQNKYDRENCNSWPVIL